jgi:hypothetical protein
MKHRKVKNFSYEPFVQPVEIFNSAEEVQEFESNSVLGLIKIILREIEDNKDYRYMEPEVLEHRKYEKLTSHTYGYMDSGDRYSVAVPYRLVSKPCVCGIHSDTFRYVSSQPDTGLWVKQCDNCGFSTSSHEKFNQCTEEWNRLVDGRKVNAGDVH